MGSAGVEEEEFPLLMAVIDGMGGYGGGEIASRVLAETLARAASQNLFDSSCDPNYDANVLENLLIEASGLMTDASKSDPSISQMGATVAGILVRERYALAFNCGDCRTYRISCGVLERLTHDHSLVRTLFENGAIDEDGMRKHPNKNVVTSAVAANAKKPPELYTRAVSRVEGDAYFICSDGVWEALGVPELESCLNGNFPDSAARLFDSLISVNCRDNVSFIWAV
jgi:protein phosphatase